jgi:hypothetical protein
VHERKRASCAPEAIKRTTTLPNWAAGKFERVEKEEKSRVSLSVSRVRSSSYIFLQRLDDKSFLATNRQQALQKKKSSSHYSRFSCITSAILNWLSVCFPPT